MKKLCLFAIVCAVLAQICGCSGSDLPDNVVMLPDTLKCHGARPQVSGNLDTFIVIVPDQYRFEFGDSVSKVDILLKLKKKLEIKGNRPLFIENPEDAAYEQPYLEILDDMGEVIPGVYLPMDSTKVVRIRSLLRADLQAEIEVCFSCGALRESLIDSIREYGANFRLVANYTTEVNESKVDMYIDMYEKGIAKHNEYAAMGADVNREPTLSEYRVDENHLDDIRAKMRLYWPYMTKEQRSRYNSIKSSEKKVVIREDVEEERAAREEAARARAEVEEARARSEKKEQAPAEEKESKADPAAETKPAAVPEAKPEAAPEPKPEPAPQPKPETKEE